MDDRLTSAMQTDDSESWDYSWQETWDAWSWPALGERLIAWMVAAPHADELRLTSSVLVEVR